MWLDVVLIEIWIELLITVRHTYFSVLVSSAVMAQIHSTCCDWIRYKVFLWMAVPNWRNSSTAYGGQPRYKYSKFKWKLTPINKELFNMTFIYDCVPTTKILDMQDVFLICNSFFLTLVSACFLCLWLNESLSTFVATVLLLLLLCEVVLLWFWVKSLSLFIGFRCL